MTTAAAKVIGAFLIEKGFLSREQLDEIIQEQGERGLRFVDAAVERGYLSEEHYLEAVGEYLDIPYRPKIDVQVNSSILSKVPLSFIKENRLVPICEEDGGSCLVAVHDPFTQRAQFMRAAIFDSVDCIIHGTKQRYTHRAMHEFSCTPHRYIFKLADLLPCADTHAITLGEEGFKRENSCRCCPPARSAHGST